MKRRLIPLSDVVKKDIPFTGGKAWALSELIRGGVPVPAGLVVSTRIYEDFLELSGLGDLVFMELTRKELSGMRWEEIWDLSLRIRNLFIRTPIPKKIQLELAPVLDEKFSGLSTVVRSSSPSEDSSVSSFAGLHESFVNVQGTERIIEKIRLVWASLWSDGALLYRRELGLDIRKSSMAVVVQEIVNGDRSGVFFTKDPGGRDRSVLEAVWGLNQGLVDGTVEPDRWFLSRQEGLILSHTPPLSRDIFIVPLGRGTGKAPIPPEKASSPPLKEGDVARVRDMAMTAEELFGFPQDVEWTWKDQFLCLVQSRPITTIKATEGPAHLEDDRRAWYLSLKRSFEDLCRLRESIEKELIPAMDEESGSFSRIDPSGLNDTDLAEELERRKDSFEKWKRTYWEEFIPFAHGARLFGQYYNDNVSPEDPYEFVELLKNTDMESMRRNRKMEDLATMVRSSATLRNSLLRGDRGDRVFESALMALIKEEPLGLEWIGMDEERGRMVRIILEMAELPPKKDPGVIRRSAELKEKLLDSLGSTEEKDFALELLDLARASWKLRDDDNLHLGRLERELSRAMEEGRKRLSGKFSFDTARLEFDQLTLCLSDSSHMPEFPQSVPVAREGLPGLETRARQLKGHPANAGLVSGKARIIRRTADLFSFRKGEILVCDAIDPNMTFIVPLAAGVVERRGGMLIHGAIIAREYGLPCVTGVADVTRLIPDGAAVTVDGYLGIVIIGE
ncbi:MAG TPA: PEP/pyruvate-binding domain-containing protein [Synergistales bacterium]|nr:PEP/pyruvate-binding domain-containing protein [Synergistales bacterium]